MDEEDAEVLRRRALKTLGLGRRSDVADILEAVKRCERDAEEAEGEGSKSRLRKIRRASEILLGSSKAAEQEKDGAKKEREKKERTGRRKSEGKKKSRSRIQLPTTVESEKERDGQGEGGVSGSKVTTGNEHEQSTTDAEADGAGEGVMEDTPQGRGRIEEGRERQDAPVSSSDEDKSIEEEERVVRAITPATSVEDMGTETAKPAVEGDHSNTTAPRGVPDPSSGVEEKTLREARPEAGQGALTDGAALEDVGSGLSDLLARDGDGEMRVSEAEESGAQANGDGENRGGHRNVLPERISAREWELRRSRGDGSPAAQERSIANGAVVRRRKSQVDVASLTPAERLWELRRAVKRLQRGDGRDKRARRACLDIAQIAGGNVDLRDEALAMGAAEEAVRVLANRDSGAGALKAAAHCVTVLSADCADAQRRLSNARAVSKLLSVLESTKRVSVAEYVIAALHNLLTYKASQEQAVECGALRTLPLLLAQSEESLCRGAAGALYNLTCCEAAAMACGAEAVQRVVKAAALEVTLCEPSDYTSHSTLLAVLLGTLHSLCHYAPKCAEMAAQALVVSSVIVPVVNNAMSLAQPFNTLPPALSALHVATSITAPPIGSRAPVGETLLLVAPAISLVGGQAPLHHAIACDLIKNLSEVGGEVGRALCSGGVLGRLTGTVRSQQSRSIARESAASLRHILYYNPELAVEELRAHELLPVLTVRSEVEDACGRYCRDVVRIVDSFDSGRALPPITPRAHPSIPQNELSRKPHGTPSTRLTTTAGTEVREGVFVPTIAMSKGPKAARSALGQSPQQRLATRLAVQLPNTPRPSPLDEVRINFSRLPPVPTWENQARELLEQQTYRLQQAVAATTTPVTHRAHQMREGALDLLSPRQSPHSHEWRGRRNSSSSSDEENPSEDRGVGVLQSLRSQIAGVLPSSRRHTPSTPSTTSSPPKSVRPTL